MQRINGAIEWIEFVSTLFSEIGDLLDDASHVLDLEIQDDLNDDMEALELF